MTPLQPVPHKRRTHAYDDIRIPKTPRRRRTPKTPPDPFGWLKNATLSELAYIGHAAHRLTVDGGGCPDDAPALLALTAAVDAELDRRMTPADTPD